MRLATLMIIVFVAFGCATAEEGTRIMPDEVTWIEKEKTTRAEIVARFGSPPVEFPQSSGFTTTSTTTTITTTDLDGHVQTAQTTTQVERPSSLRKATYAYTRRNPARFPFYDNERSTQSEFWVVYDERGVVQDYGFLGGLPITIQAKVASSAIERQQTIAASQLADNTLEDPYEP